MPVTSPSISFGRNAIAISDDINTITVVHGGTGAYADTDDLEKIVAVQNRLITLEPDFWLLDGQYKFIPSTSHFGYMSTALSDGSGTFAASVPKLSITFNNVFSTNGLTLEFSPFSGDWCDSITIAFYNSGGGLIRTDNYTPTSADFATAQAVSNFKRVDISFNSSNKPYRYVRLSNIVFDDLVTFSNSEIKSAKLIEEIDPVSISLHSNMIEFVIHSTATGFGITDPTGFYADLRDNEPLDVYEKIDNDVVYLGRFYLDKWESLSENEASFHAYDMFRQLENIQYVGGIFHTTLGAPAETRKADDLISRLSLYYSNNFQYTIDTALNASTFQVYGLIPIVNIRQALRSICFMMGGYATYARSKTIQFRKTELASSLSIYDYTLTSANIGINPKLSMLSLITGVEISVFDYTLQVDPLYVPPTLVNKDYILGETTINVFSGPNYTINYIAGTTGSFTFNGSTNTQTIVCATAGHLNLIGSEYLDNKKNVTQYTVGLPAGTTPNIIKIEDEKLVSSFNSADVLSLVYDYYQQRYFQRIKLFASHIAVGDSVYVDTQSGKHLKGIVERMETDLARGFVSVCDVVGVIV